MNILKKILYLSVISSCFSNNSYAMQSPENTVTKRLIDMTRRAFHAQVCKEVLGIENSFLPSPSELDLEAYCSEHDETALADLGDKISVTAIIQTCQQYVRKAIELGGKAYVTLVLQKITQIDTIYSMISRIFPDLAQELSSSQCTEIPADFPWEKILTL